MGRNEVQRLKKKRRREARQQRAVAAREGRVRGKALADAMARGEFTLSPKFFREVVGLSPTEALAAAEMPPAAAAKIAAYEEARRRLELGAEEDAAE